MQFKIIRRLKMTKVIIKTGAPSHEVVVETYYASIAAKSTGFVAEGIRKQGASGKTRGGLLDRRLNTFIRRNAVDMRHRSR